MSLRGSWTAVGCAVAALCLAGPPSALGQNGTEVSVTTTTAEYDAGYDEPWPGDLSEVPPDEDAFAENRAPNLGIGFLASVGSSVLSAVVYPVKMVIGVGGAVVGGTAGALTGGDQEAAAGIWNVTTDGSYYVTPEILEGRAPFVPAASFD
jgi:hypothetical protein